MKIVPIFLLLLAFYSLSAQGPTKTHIINSHNYYYGSGISTDENRAREEAIRELSEMISVTVASEFEHIGTETNMQYEEFASSVIKTYATSTLKNVEQNRTVAPDGQIEVFCYMSKEVVKKLYNERAEMAYKMYINANENIERGNLAFAFKNLYFASLLIKSIPEDRVIVHDKEISLEIPRTLNRTMQNIQFKLIGDEMKTNRERRICFSVNFMGKPVSLLHFRFWDGNQITGNGQVRDGITTIKLAGNSVAFDELKIFVEYGYYNSRREFQAVEDLWEIVDRPTFNNQFTIDLTRQQTIAPAQPTKVSVPATTNLILEMDQEIRNTESLLLSANKFLAILETGQVAEAQKQYGDDPFLYNKMAAYLRYNKPEPATGDVTANVNKTRTGYEVRKLQVNHQYPSLHKQATEYLVLDFDTTGTLVDFNLCITDDLYEKFVEQAGYGKDWGNRQEIIKFVEKYRTAFLTRNIETINLMFAEEALILIGRKIQPRENPASEVSYQQLPGQPNFVQIQYTKEQYLKNQQRVFDIQKDIFIDFSTFDIVKKNNAEGVYGVEMRQNYSSTTYADEGYLFLLIDFNGADPLIYIRAWQPNEWDSAALVNTSNFRVYK